MNNFKSDDSFLRKLVVGAEGTKATMHKLNENGFHTIELERGSTSFKIWKKIKIKRIRIPDILCLKTGIRFESRGKTKLEISMSHSMNNDKRRWDCGMRDDDIVSIMLFNQDAQVPVKVTLDSPIHFIKVSEMKKAYRSKLVKFTKPKGTEEGSEVRIIWISATAHSDSKVTEITDKRICLEPLSGGRKQYIQLKRKNGVTLIPQVALEETVLKNQIVAAVVPVKTIIEPPIEVNEEYFIQQLDSETLSERYAAAKALRCRHCTSAEIKLYERMNDNKEDIYVRLEAAAALASNGKEEAWTFLSDKLQKAPEEVPLETQLETIIVLSEINNTTSEELIIGVLKNKDCIDELRAGAAWALGQFSSRESAIALAETFNSTSIDVKSEAARALLRIAKPQIDTLLDLIKNSESNRRDGLAWVLARTGNFNPSTLISEDENLRKWLSYIVGYEKQYFSEDLIKGLCDADKEIYFASSVLWQILSSWIYELTEY